MGTLKKILAAMVGIFVLIVVVGGLYVVSGGHLDHGSTAAVQSQQHPAAPEEPKNNTSSQNQKTGEGGTDTEKSDSKNRQTLPPVIVQVPLPTPQADPSLYVEILKEKLNSINKNNAAIASNSGGATGPQQDNQTSNSGHMNELHIEFYQLGQNVAAMEFYLDRLGKEIRTGQSLEQPANNAQGYYYLTPYGQVIPPNQSQQGSTGAHSDPAQQQAHQGAGHGAGALDLLNINTFKAILALILTISIVFAIIAVIGFIGSLFKSEKPTSPNL